MGSLNERISGLQVTACRIPTEMPESDGTLAWDSTTIVLVEATAGDKTGLGYTYNHAATGMLIADTLAGEVLGGDPFDRNALVEACARRCRNFGRQGLVAAAISAVDTALWDLKSKLLDLSLVRLLGACREAVDIYGSGGFTSMPRARLREQLAGWVEQGIPRVKMKVGRDPSEDVARVAEAREAIGDRTELFVDANGAYDRKQALEKAQAFADYGVCWFEEPVTSDDFDGLRLVRDRVPAGMEVAAGEYGWDRFSLRRMTGAVDVLQADATRCGGITGFLGAGELCRAEPMPLSAHTAPALHAHVGCVVESVRHIEYFADHVRVEEMLFDGALRPIHGQLRPDRSRPGLGLELKHSEVERFTIWKQVAS